MKRTILMILAVAVAGAVALGFTGAALAQDPDPLYPGNGGGNGGNGRPEGAGSGTGVPLAMNINLDGALDDQIAAYIAAELGISIEDLKAREAAGETLVEIGLSLGFDAETIWDLHTAARLDALAQAVADGLLTQEQADWLASRLENGQYGMATGLCTGDCTGMQTGARQMRGRGGASQP
jgi:hypothetical protein